MGANLVRARDQERQFLLSVSHELRTPLTSIRGYADAVLDGATDDPDGGGHGHQRRGPPTRAPGPGPARPGPPGRRPFLPRPPDGRLSDVVRAGGRRLPAPGRGARAGADRRPRIGCAPVGGGRRRPAGPGGGQPGRERLLLRRPPGGGRGGHGRVGARRLGGRRRARDPPRPAGRVFERHFTSDRVQREAKGVRVWAWPSCPSWPRPWGPPCGPSRRSPTVRAPGWWCGCSHPAVRPPHPRARSGARPRDRSGARPRDRSGGRRGPRRGPGPGNSPRHRRPASQGSDHQHGQEIRWMTSC